MAALLAALQLLVVVVLPLSHDGAVARSLAEQASHVQQTGGAEHTEPPPRGGHDDAVCYFCRLADARYLLNAAGSPAVRSTETAAAAAPEARSWLRTVAWHLPHGPRPPPSA